LHIYNATYKTDSINIQEIIFINLLDVLIFLVINLSWVISALVIGRKIVLIIKKERIKERGTPI
jgi:hypothetical protein